MIEYKKQDEEKILEKYIFISFSNIDNEIATKVANLLDENNISYWKAPEILPIEFDSETEIPKAIEECSAFMVLLSKSSQTSDIVKKELVLANECEKTIIPVAIDNMPLDFKLEPFFKESKIIAYYRNALRANCQIIETAQTLINDLSGNSYINSQISGSTRNSNSFSDLNLITLTPGMMRKIQKEEDCKRIQQREQEEFERMQQIRSDEKRRTLLYDGTQEAFAKIKNLLNQKGPMSVDEIYYETGISRDVIKDYVRQERLEIPGNMPAVFICERCGARIRTGILCNKCKMDDSWSIRNSKNVFHIKSTSK